MESERAPFLWKEKKGVDAFIKKFNIQDPAVEKLAVIVRAADTDCLNLSPQASGLLAITLGLSENLKDDHVMLAQGLGKGR